MKSGQKIEPHVDEVYMDWQGVHHTVNSGIAKHDSTEACEFAEFYLAAIDEHRLANSPQLTFESCMERVKPYFPNANIINGKELVLVPKTNTYFEVCLATMDWMAFDISMLKTLLYAVNHTTAGGLKEYLIRGLTSYFGQFFTKENITELHAAVFHKDRTELQLRILVSHMRRKELLFK